MASEGSQAVSDPRTAASTEEIQRSDTEFRQSVEGVEAIIQSISDGIIVADEHGRIEIFNRAAEDLLGIGMTDTPPDEWSATYGVFLPDGVTHCPTEALPLAQAIRGETVDDMELVINNPHLSRPVSIHARARPILDERGHARGGVVIFHDVTAEKHAKAEMLKAREELETRVAQRTKELRISQSRYHDLYDNAPDMFLSVDAESDCVIRCNKALLSATGFRKQDVVGCSLLKLIVPKCLPLMERTFRIFVETGEVKDVELLLRRADGGTIDVSLNMSAVRDEGGRITHSRSVMRDITARKRAEEQVRLQQQELNHNARVSTMGEMAAGLAHELNQPLAAIAAYATGSAFRIRDGNVLPMELVDILDRIAADAHRAGEIIRRLRRFVKRRDTELGPLDVNHAIREMCRFVGAEAAELETALHLELEQDLPRARGDSVEVQQVVLNLLRNSLEAIRDANVEERRILVETRRTDHDKVEVTIEDTGGGISEVLMDQAFEQFFTSKDEGLGMGLAISRSIVEAHGGEIWISDSELGARVHFTVPLMAQQELEDGH